MFGIPYQYTESRILKARLEFLRDNYRSELPVFRINNGESDEIRLCSSRERLPHFRCDEACGAMCGACVARKDGLRAHGVLRQGARSTLA